MLTCSFCFYKGRKWDVKNVAFEMETSTVFYELTCPECDSEDVCYIVSDSQDDEATTT